MLIKESFLCLVGLTAGFAVSAGTFAFMIVIGVIPRMIGKCNRAAETMHFENAIILGGISWQSDLGLFRDPHSVWRTVFVCLWNIGGHFCGLYRGGTGGDLKYISDHVPKDWFKTGTALRDGRHGTWQDTRGTLLFLPPDRVKRAQMTFFFFYSILKKEL